MKERDREKREIDRWRERLNERDRKSRLTVDEPPS